MLVLEVYPKKTALFEQYRKAMGYGKTHKYNCLLNRQIVQSHQKIKDFIINVIAKPPLRSLLCYFLFLIYYTLFFTIWVISY